jgi:hypothetical protein
MLEYLLGEYAPRQTGCLSNCDNCINAHGSPAHAGFCRAFYDEPNGVCSKWQDMQRPALKPLTQDEAMHMARECGALVESWMTNPPKPGLFYMTPEQITHFASLIAQGIKDKP